MLSRHINASFQLTRENPNELLGGRAALVRLITNGIGWEAPSITRKKIGNSARVDDRYRIHEVSRQDSFPHYTQKALLTDRTTRGGGLERFFASLNR